MRSKISILLLLATLTLPSAAVFAADNTPVKILDAIPGSVSITFYLSNLNLQSPQEYFVYCYATSNEGSSKSVHATQPAITPDQTVNVTVGPLKAATKYICQAGVATPSQNQNGAWDMSQNSPNLPVSTTGEKVDCGAPKHTGSAQLVSPKLDSTVKASATTKLKWKSMNNTCALIQYSTCFSSDTYHSSYCISNGKSNSLTVSEKRWSTIIKSIYGENPKKGSKYQLVWYVQTLYGKLDNNKVIKGQAVDDSNVYTLTVKF